MSSSRFQVVGLAGQMGAGKSSVARALGASLGWTVGSFGDYVREVAAASGLELNRDNLQQVGAELIESLSAEEFIARVVSKSGWDRASGLVIEGIRHPHIAEALPRFFRPRPYALVYLSAPRELRELRLRERDGASELDIGRAERHSTEREIATHVEGLADVVVRATSDASAAASEIAKALGLDG